MGKKRIYVKHYYETTEQGVLPKEGFQYDAYAQSLRKCRISGGLGIRQEGRPQSREGSQPRGQHEQRRRHSKHRGVSWAHSTRHCEKRDTAGEEGVRKPVILRRSWAFHSEAPAYSSLGM